MKKKVGSRSHTFFWLMGAEQWSRLALWSPLGGGPGYLCSSS